MVDPIPPSMPLIECTSRVRYWVNNECRWLPEGWSIVDGYIEPLVSRHDYIPAAYCPICQQLSCSCLSGYVGQPQEGYIPAPAYGMPEPIMGYPYCPICQQLSCRCLDGYVQSPSYQGCGDLGGVPHG